MWVIVIVSGKTSESGLLDEKWKWIGIKSESKFWRNME